MTLRDIVAKLQAEGHTVEYRVRTDGSIIIKRIDSQKFTYGATGNVAARAMAKQSLDKRRASQLEYATRAKSAYKSVDEQITEEFKRVKKIWKKAFPYRKGKPHPAGYFGITRIKYTMKRYGKEEALRRILEAEKYATGLAYSKNVAFLAAQIRKAAADYQSEELSKLADDIEANGYTIREEWISNAYEALYKLNDGMPPKEVARNVRKILRL